MSTVQEIEKVIQTLSKEEIAELRQWIEDYLEDEMEFTDTFKAQIEQGKRDVAEGRVRVRQP